MIYKSLAGHRCHGQLRRSSRDHQFNLLIVSASRNHVEAPVSCGAECKAKPMEMAFVVDASASIWPQNFTLGLNFIEDFVGFFDIGEEKVSARII
ncbi:hypothetical protein BaRGS_00034406 [Batillaria attramentaria]|uniref:Uncharacterized protein n=1 Tax=Batillaria attramentaria TaxID=370345 RepID=A0ABD0JHI6_9CAEN